MSSPKCSSLYIVGTLQHISILFSKLGVQIKRIFHTCLVILSKIMLQQVDFILL